MKTLFGGFCTVLIAFANISISAQMRRIEPLFPCSPLLGDAYGICSHITRRSMDFDFRHDDIRYALCAGARTIRSDFDFSTVFPSSIDFADDTVFDSVLNSCDSSDIELLPIIVGATDKGWAWENMPTYLTYVQHIAQRYATRIHYWEIINEINLQKRFPQEELATNYAHVLQNAAQTIRTESPQAQIVFGGMGEADSIFLTNVCKDGATPQAFDIMNFHSYNSPEELPRSFKRLADIMRLQHWEKAVWLTETGFSTPPSENSHEGFWNELVPYACKYLGIDPMKSTIAIVCDPKRDVQFSTEQGGDYFKKFGKTKIINCDAIKDLDPAKTPFLLAAYGEYFPKDFVNDVTDFVRRGGTLICPNGVPFYYDTWTTKGFTSSGANHHKAFHIAFKYWWSDDAKRIGLPEIPTWKSNAQGINLNYTWIFSSGSSARYIDTANLHEGDTFIPLLLAGTEQTAAPVAGVFKLRSDLKGNIIIQTRIDTPSRNETIQAQRVARAFIISFAYGVDRVFWYHLRSFEQNPADWESYYGILHKDFSVKPAYNAYKTLTSMLPKGSTRPRLKTDGLSYEATWLRPDKTCVTACWSLVPGITYTPESKKVEMYDYLGNKIKCRHVELNAGVVYIVEK